jgi:hypothetical protein
MLPRHVRHEGLRQIEHHLTSHSLGREHAKKTIELEKARALPDANIPKIVSFPAT